MLDEQRAAELRVGDTALTVRLVDQSATGFLIECDRHPGVYAGEKVWLQTTLGWTEVKVIKIRHEIEVTRIGLERLADISLEYPKTTGVIRSDALAHETPYGSPWPTIIMIAALLGVMAFLTWIAYARRHGDDKYGRSAAAISLEQHAERQGKQLRKSLQEFGAALLIMPEVAQSLKLSDEQLADVRRILDEALTRERQLRDSGLSDVDLQQQFVVLHREATQQATDLLTSEQGDAWKTMFAEALVRLKQDTEPRAAAGESR